LLVAEPVAAGDVPDVPASAWPEAAPPVVDVPTSARPEVAPPVVRARRRPLAFGVCASEVLEEEEEVSDVEVVVVWSLCLWAGLAGAGVGAGATAG
jgi:hypothetical protein